jgi:hypothetical protein
VSLSLSNEAIINIHILIINLKLHVDALECNDSDKNLPFAHLQLWGLFVGCVTLGNVWREAKEAREDNSSTRLPFFKILPT